MTIRRNITETLVGVLVVWGVVGAFTAISGCDSTNTVGSIIKANTPQYELTLSGTMDGVAFKGIALGSSATQHNFKFSSPYSTTKFAVRTCARSPTYDNKSDSFTWQYNQEYLWEAAGDCPLRLCIFSDEVGAPPEQCAVIDFKHDKYTLPGEVHCDGQSALTTGSAICHEESGIFTAMGFSTPVDVATPAQPNQCEGKFIPDPKDPTKIVWEAIMPMSECKIIFTEKAKPHRHAKLVLVPFNARKYPANGGK